MTGVRASCVAPVRGGGSEACDLATVGRPIAAASSRASATNRRAPEGDNEAGRFMSQKPCSREASRKLFEAGAERIAATGKREGDGSATRRSARVHGFSHRRPRLDWSRRSAYLGETATLPEHRAYIVAATSRFASVV